jgi:centromere protein J
MASSFSFSAASCSVSSSSSSLCNEPLAEKIQHTSSASIASSTRGSVDPVAILMRIEKLRKWQEEEEKKLWQTHEDQIQQLQLEHEQKAKLISSAANSVANESSSLPSPSPSSTSRSSSSPPLGPISTTVGKQQQQSQRDHNQLGEPELNSSKASINENDLKLIRAYKILTENLKKNKLKERLEQVSNQGEYDDFDDEHDDEEEEEEEEEAIGVDDVDDDEYFKYSKNDHIVETTNTTDFANNIYENGNKIEEFFSQKYIKELKELLFDENNHDDLTAEAAAHLSKRLSTILEASCEDSPIKQPSAAFNGFSKSKLKSTQEKNGATFNENLTKSVCRKIIEEDESNEKKNQESINKNNQDTDATQSRPIIEDNSANDNTINNNSTKPISTTDETTTTTSLTKPSNSNDIDSIPIGIKPTNKMTFEELIEEKLKIADQLDMEQKTKNSKLKRTFIKKNATNVGNTQTTTAAVLVPVLNKPLKPATQASSTISAKAALESNVVSGNQSNVATSSAVGDSSTSQFAQQQQQQKQPKKYLRRGEGLKRYQPRSKSSSSNINSVSSQESGASVSLANNKTRRSLSSLNNNNINSTSSGSLASINQKSTLKKSQSAASIATGFTSATTLNTQRKNTENKNELKSYAKNVTTQKAQSTSKNLNNKLKLSLQYSSTENPLNYPKQAQYKEKQPTSYRSSSIGLNQGSQDQFNSKATSNSNERNTLEIADSVVEENKDVDELSEFEQLEQYAEEHASFRSTVSYVEQVLTTKRQSSSSGGVVQQQKQLYSTTTGSNFKYLDDLIEEELNTRDIKNQIENNSQTYFDADNQERVRTLSDSSNISNSRLSGVNNRSNMNNSCKIPVVRKVKRLSSDFYENLDQQNGYQDSSNRRSSSPDFYEHHIDKPKAYSYANYVKGDDDYENYDHDEKETNTYEDQYEKQSKQQRELGNQKYELNEQEYSCEENEKNSSLENEIAANNKILNEKLRNMALNLRMNDATESNIKFDDTESWATEQKSTQIEKPKQQEKLEVNGSIDEPIRPWINQSAKLIGKLFPSIRLPNSTQEQVPQSTVSTNLNNPASTLSSSSSSISSATSPSVAAGLLKEKFDQLESEIDKFQKKNAQLSKLKEKCEHEIRSYEQLRKQFDKQKEEELNRLKDAHEEEMRKLKQEKRIFEQYKQSFKETPDRREREEIERLKRQLAELVEELKSKEARWTANNNRLKERIETLENEKIELKHELQLVEKQRIESLMMISSSNKVAAAAAIMAPGVESASSAIRKQPEQTIPIQIPTNTINSNLYVDKSLDNAYFDLNVRTKQQNSIEKSTTQMRASQEAAHDPHHQLLLKRSTSEKSLSSSSSSSCSSSSSASLASTGSLALHSNLKYAGNQMNTIQQEPNETDAYLPSKTEASAQAKFTQLQTSSSTQSPSSLFHNQQQHLQQLQMQQTEQLIKANEALHRYLNTNNLMIGTGLNENSYEMPSSSPLSSSSSSCSSSTNSSRQPVQNTLARRSAPNISHQAIINSSSQGVKSVKFKLDQQPINFPNTNADILDYTIGISSNTKQNSDMKNPNTLMQQTLINSGTSNGEILTSAETCKNEYVVSLISENANEEAKKLRVKETRQFDDKRVEKILEDGSIQTKFQNGTLKEVSGDKRHTFVRFFNGDQKEINHETGTETYFYAETNITQIIYSNGLEILKFPNGQIEKHHPNKTREIIFPDKICKFIYADGSEESRLPNGTIIKIDKNGDKIIEYTNKQREFHTKDFKRREYPDGSIKTVYTNGISETRYANGRIRIKDSLGNLISDKKV